MSVSRTVGEKYWFKGLPFDEWRVRDTWGEKYWCRGLPSEGLLPLLTPVLLPSGIVSEEAFGIPVVTGAGVIQNLYPTGIASEEAVGNQVVIPPIDPTFFLKVFQEVAQVEWIDPPLLKVAQVTGQVEYYEYTYMRTYQVIGQVEYDPVPPPKRQFPIPNVKTRWQSQAGKREFPVVA